MKKKKHLIFLVLMCAFVCLGKLEYAHADNTDKYTNNNNIIMTSADYQRLLNLGFTPFEISNMQQAEYDANHNLIGEVVSQNVKYYKTVTAYSPITKEAILTDTFEVDEHEYNNSVDPQAKGNGYIETAYKKMTTQIIWMNIRYRYKVTLEWKTMPSNRSYDIIGLGLDPAEVYILNSDVSFQQDYCYTNGNCESSNFSRPKATTTGGGVVFPLPTGSLRSLSSYLYYMVAKENESVPLTKMHAYGDYAHATSTTSMSSDSHYGIGSGGLSLDVTIISKYDAINTAEATWSGSW